MYDPFAKPGDPFRIRESAEGYAKEKLAEDEEERRKKFLAEQAAAAAGFANQGQAGYGNMTAELAKQRQFLMDLASGKNSIAAEQLRQGLQQNLAGQQSMAAGASPQNAVMAARTAMMNSARLGSGLAGQQALAGLKERQDAQQALAALNLGQRGQDVNVGLGGRGLAIQGQSQGAVGVTPKEPTLFDRILQVGSAVAPFGGLLKNKPEQQGGGLGPASGTIVDPNAWTYSDRRLKHEVKDGDEEANTTLNALKARVFRYKDAKHGGRELGVMAQDLEAGGLGHAVVDTPRGKAVHGAKLATSNTAMLGALARRVAKLEGKGRR